MDDTRGRYTILFEPADLNRHPTPAGGGRVDRAVSIGEVVSVAKRGPPRQSSWAMSRLVIAEFLLLSTDAQAANRLGSGPTEDDMSRAVVLLVVMLVGGVSIGGVAGQQGQPAPAVRDIQKVRDNLYFISGGDTYDRGTWTGGNSAVLVTDRGVVLVDTMLPKSGRGILDRIKSVTDKPVITIINTHTHYDHSGSNTEFPATVEFVAHENTRANMAKPTCEPVTNCDAFKGENAKYLPKRTYKDRLSLMSGKDQIDLYYFGRGHTNGDTFVVFPAARAMHTGDMYPRSHMPFIDVANNGGDAVEFSQTLRNAVTTIKNVDTVIGGHTPSPVTWNDFKTFTDFYADFLAAAQGSKKKGVAVDEFVKAYRVPDKYKGFQADPQRVKANAEAIYNAR
jgi:glyoxylase-like metal-dependent hydrolase (beta-lactamase superfamily II)